MFDSLNKNELNWWVVRWCQCTREFSLMSLVSYMPLQENDSGFTSGKDNLGGHLVHLPHFTDEKVGQRCLGELTLSSLFVSCFWDGIVEWSLEFKKKIILLSIVMVYCRLVARGKLCYIIFMVMGRAKLFTGVCTTRQYSKCFFHICSFNPKNHVR